MALLSYLTTLLHRFPDSSDFDQRAQEYELEYIKSSRHAQRWQSNKHDGHLRADAAGQSRQSRSRSRPETAGAHSGLGYNTYATAVTPERFQEILAESATGAEPNVDANVSIARIADDFVALTDGSTLPVRYDPDSLDRCRRARSRCGAT